jgi:hypothetical protein
MNKLLLSLVVALIFASGCTRYEREQQFLNHYMNTLPSFGLEEPAQAELKHKQLLEEAILLERDHRFRKMDANRVIGYILLRMAVLEEVLGKSSSFDEYRSQSIERMVLSKIIPSDYTKEQKMALWSKEREQLLEFEKPKWAQRP